jgi:hypothetical protein
MAILIAVSSCGGGGTPPEVITPPPIGRICTWDVPAGQNYTFVDAPGNVAPVPFQARVYHGATDTLCTAFDSKLHPLVIFGHGRYPLGVPTNYLGMTNLMDHLASWGDICMSVNLDVVSAINDNPRGIGIPHRAELLLHAIEFMAKECRTPGSVFYQRVDTTKIALIGHGRPFCRQLQQPSPQPPYQSRRDHFPRQFWRGSNERGRAAFVDIRVLGWRRI